MTDVNDNDPILPGDESYETEDMPVESPRRAASARFVVDTEITHHHAIREAMDPANQSLAEALRLSFRVLQVVILVLIVLFLFSGWKNVGDGYTGIRTVWGRIVERDGDAALDTGWQVSWPYPAGEFHVVRESNRPVELMQEFWPRIRGGTFESRIEAAGEGDKLKPGYDGTVLTAEGDIAHLQLSSQYSIEDPASFLETLRDEDADRIVNLALQRAVVHSGARLPLTTIVDKSNEMGADIERDVSASLASLGIKLGTVSISQSTAPAAVRKTLDSLQLAAFQADESMERARERATQVLTETAGENHQAIIQRINEYEQVVDTGDEALVAERLAAVNEVLQDDLTGGEISSVIAFALAYQSQIETSLGQEARRFASLLEEYRRTPDTVIQRRWSESYASVLGVPDAEPYFVPLALQHVNLRLTGLDRIAQMRVQRDLDRREMQTNMSFATRGGKYRRAEDWDGRNRQLDRGQGGLSGKGR